MPEQRFFVLFSVLKLVSLSMCLQRSASASFDTCELEMAVSAKTPKFI